jgi:hypothetical protein
VEPGNVTGADFRDGGQERDSNLVLKHIVVSGDQKLRPEIHLVRYVKAIGVLAGVLPMIIGLTGCVIMSENIIINHTSHDLIAKYYFIIGQQMDEKPGSYIIRPNEIKSFHCPTHRESFLEVWAGDTFIVKKEFPRKAIATQIEIRQNEQGEFQVRGKYADIGEYPDKSHPARKRPSTTGVPFSPATH